MRTPLRTALLVALAAVGFFAVVPAHAESSTGAYGSRLVTLINNARAQHGLRALTVTSGTSTVATTWTEHLAGAQALSHNPNLGPQLESHGSSNWTTYGENVGEAPSSSADTLFNAYMNSPEHRDNILDSHYRYVGVGVVFSGSTAWNTLDFVDQYSSSSTTTTSSSKPASAPRVTRPTSTAKTTQAAPRPATRTTHRTAVVHHVVVRPAAASAHPAAAPRKVHPAVRHAAPAPAPATAPASAATPVTSTDATPVAASLPLPLRVPHHRPMLPTLVALALLALLVGSFGRAVTTRGA